MLIQNEEVFIFLFFPLVVYCSNQLIQYERQIFLDNITNLDKFNKMKLFLKILIQEDSHQKFLWLIDQHQTQCDNVKCCCQEYYKEKEKQIEDLILQQMIEYNQFFYKNKNALYLANISMIVKKDIKKQFKLLNQVQEENLSNKQKIEFQVIKLKLYAVYNESKNNNKQVLKTFKKQKLIDAFQYDIVRVYQEFFRMCRCQDQENFSFEQIRQNVINISSSIKNINKIGEFLETNLVTLELWQLFNFYFTKNQSQLKCIFTKITKLREKLSINQAFFSSKKFDYQFDKSVVLYIELNQQNQTSIKRGYGNIKKHLNKLLSEIKNKPINCLLPYIFRQYHYQQIKKCVLAKEISNKKHQSQVVIETDQKICQIFDLQVQLSFNISNAQQLNYYACLKPLEKKNCIVIDCFGYVTSIGQFVKDILLDSVTDFDFVPLYFLMPKLLQTLLPFSKQLQMIFKNEQQNSHCMFQKLVNFEGNVYLDKLNFSQIQQINDLKQNIEKYKSIKSLISFQSQFFLDYNPNFTITSQIEIYNTESGPIFVMMIQDLVKITDIEKKPKIKRVQQVIQSEAKSKRRLSRLYKDYINSKLLHQNSFNKQNYFSYTQLENKNSKQICHQTNRGVNLLFAKKKCQAQKYIKNKIKQKNIIQKFFTQFISIFTQFVYDNYQKMLLTIYIVYLVCAFYCLIHDFHKYIVKEGEQNQKNLYLLYEFQNNLAFYEQCTYFQKFLKSRPKVYDLMDFLKQKTYDLANQIKSATINYKWQELQTSQILQKHHGILYQIISNVTVLKDMDSPYFQRLTKIFQFQNSDQYDQFTINIKNIDISERYQYIIQKLLRLQLIPVILAVFLCIVKIFGIYKKYKEIHKLEKKAIKVYADKNSIFQTDQLKRFVQKAKSILHISNYINLKKIRKNQIQYIDQNEQKLNILKKSKSDKFIYLNSILQLFPFILIIILMQQQSLYNGRFIKDYQNYFQINNYQINKRLQIYNQCMKYFLSKSYPDNSVYQTDLDMIHIQNNMKDIKTSRYQITQKLSAEEKRFFRRLVDQENIDICHFMNKKEVYIDLQQICEKLKYKNMQTQKAKQLLWGWWQLYINKILSYGQIIKEMNEEQQNQIFSKESDYWIDKFEEFLTPIVILNMQIYWQYVVIAQNEKELFQKMITEASFVFALYSILIVIISFFVLNFYGAYNKKFEDLYKSYDWLKIKLKNK